MFSRETTKLNVQSDVFDIVSDYSEQVNKKRINVAVKCYGVGFWLFALFFVYEAILWNSVPEKEKDPQFNKYVNPNMLTGIWGTMAAGILILAIKAMQRAKKYGWFDLTICFIHLLGYIVD